MTTINIIILLASLIIATTTGTNIVCEINKNNQNIEQTEVNNNDNVQKTE